MTERKQHRARGYALAALVLLAFPFSANAQYEEPPPPAAYALENVTVVYPDGRQERGMNLVVRRGLISVLGLGAPIPPDAVVLEGDSLRVYPGMVDARGNAPLDLPEVENLQSVLPWDPPRDAQGFTPHRLAADYLTGSGADGREARAAGVIAAGIHPDGGMAPGQSTVLLFRKDARSPRETVARPSVGLAFSFQGARGVYPSTLFAVMAYFRQMFEDAGHQGLIRTEYARSPLNMTLPRWDPDLEALRQASAGHLPVFFSAASAGDIRRVLDLAEEIGFRPVIVGGEEAWMASDRLRAMEVPVLVSVDFPRPMEWDPGAAGTTVLEPGAVREKEALENAYANAGRLVEAGITMALTSGGRGGDFREGVARAMEYGLSEADALRAVTVVPAHLLGIPDVVTVAQGMSANFIVTDGPLFNQDTEILYTFVEGQLERGSPVRRRGVEAPAAGGGGLSGTGEPGDFTLGGAGKPWVEGGIG